MIKFVCCFWNAENYIKNCIRTLKTQKDSDFEVYLIDDMSTDKGVELVKKLIEGDSRFNLDADPKFNLNADPRFNLDADPRFNIDAEPKFNLDADPKFSIDGDKRYK